MSSLLPLELLAQVLALAASEEDDPDLDHLPVEGRELDPQATGRLMVTCKRFLEATSCAAFWQDIWVVLPTMTLYHPSHVPMISRLCVYNSDRTAEGPAYPQPAMPGHASCLIYQPWLPRLKDLSVSFLFMAVKSLLSLCYVPSMPWLAACCGIAAITQREDAQYVIAPCIVVSRQFAVRGIFCHRLGAKPGHCSYTIDLEAQVHWPAAHLHLTFMFLQHVYSAAELV